MITNDNIFYVYALLDPRKHLISNNKEKFENIKYYNRCRFKLNPIEIENLLKDKLNNISDKELCLTYNITKHLLYRILNNKATYTQKLINKNNTIKQLYTAMYNMETSQ